MMDKFYDELRSLLNRHSKENGSDTPDYILANYVVFCLESFDKAVAERTLWYGYPKTTPIQEPLWEDDDETEDDETEDDTLKENYERQIRTLKKHYEDLLDDFEKLLESRDRIMYAYENLKAEHNKLEDALTLIGLRDSKIFD